MRIVVANLSAVYSGRGETVLSPYDRIVIYKSDGSVSVHNDKGFKPMNYMTATSDVIETYVDNKRVWLFSSKTETLTITFHEIFDEIDLTLGTNDPGFTSKDKTEAQLQEWLSRHLHELAPNLRFMEKEYQTGDGPVDILAQDDKNLVAVEIKRVAAINTVGQVMRYVDAMKERSHSKPIRGMIAAVEFKSKTLELAYKKGIECLQIPEDWNGKEVLTNNNLLLTGLFSDYQVE